MKQKWSVEPSGRESKLLISKKVKKKKKRPITESEKEAEERTG